MDGSKIVVKSNKIWYKVVENQCQMHFGFEKLCFQASHCNLGHLKITVSCMKMFQLKLNPLAINKVSIFQCSYNVEISSPQIRENVVKFDCGAY